jgi:hypothetical protein
MTAPCAKSSDRIQSCSALSSASLKKPRATPDWLVKKNTKYPASLSRRIAFAAFGIQRIRSREPI